MTIFAFQLDVAAVQIGFDLRVNGFSVLSGTTHRRKTLSARVDGFMVPDDNRIQASVYPVPIDPSDKERPSFQVRALATPDGEMKDDVDIVVIAAHSEEAVRMAPEGRTEVLDHTLTLAATRTRPRFLDSRPMEAETAARDLSRAVISAFETRDFARIRELYALRFDELSAAANLGRVEFEEGFMDPIEHAMKAASFAVETSPGGRLELTPGWGYRVLHVRGPGGAPPVTLRGGGVELSLGWSIAEIDGRPTIVR